MKAIDIHTHAFPDELAAKAVSALAGNTYKPFGDGTVGELVKNMSVSGISKSVLCSIATKPEQTPKITAWSKIIKEKYPQIIPFGSVHPLNGFSAALSDILEAGLKGIKMHPFYQNFVIDDEKVFPLYELIQQHGLILLFHAGYDDAYEHSDRASPRRIRNVLTKFPGLKVIAAHLGGYKQWDEVIDYLLDTDLWIDTCYIKGYITEFQQETIFNKFPRNRILLGSDYPWADQAGDIKLIQELKIPESDKELILYKNAMALLGIET